MYGDAGCHFLKNKMEGAGVNIVIVCERPETAFKSGSLQSRISPFNNFTTGKTSAKTLYPEVLRLLHTDDLLPSYRLLPPVPTLEVAIEVSKDQTFTLELCMQISFIRNIWYTCLKKQSGIYLDSLAGSVMRGILRGLLHQA